MELGFFFKCPSLYSPCCHVILLTPSCISCHFLKHVQNDQTTSDLSDKKICPKYLQNMQRQWPNVSFNFSFKSWPVTFTISQLWRRPEKKMKRELAAFPYFNPFYSVWAWPNIIIASTVSHTHTQRNPRKYSDDFRSGTPTSQLSTITQNHLNQNILLIHVGKYLPDALISADE